MDDAEGRRFSGGGPSPNTTRYLLIACGVIIAGLLATIGWLLVSGPGSPDGERRVLTLDKFGEGAVRDASGAIDCTASCSVSGAEYEAGATVELTASTPEGSEFSSWTGCDQAHGETCTVTLQEDRTVLATFTIGEVIVPETTKVIEQAAVDRLISSDGSAFVFEATAPGIAELQPGDVMVSGAGSGFARRVTTVEQQGGATLIRTEAATLAEAVEQGTLLVRMPLEASEETASAARSAALVDFTASIDGEVSPGVFLTGSATYGLELDLAISFRGFQVQEIRSVLVARSEVEARVLVGNVFSGQAERDLFRRPLRPIYAQIGPIPVVVFPEVGIYAGVEGDATAGVSANVEAGITSTAGVHYTRAFGWMGIASTTRGATGAADVRLEAEANLKAYLGAEVILRFYAIAGPSFAVDGYGRVAARAVPDAILWDLYAGVELSAGFEIDVLGLGIADYSTGVAEREWLLKSGRFTIGGRTPRTDSPPVSPPITPVISPPTSVPTIVSPPRTPFVSPPPPPPTPTRPPFISPPATPTRPPFVSPPATPTRPPFLSPPVATPTPVRFGSPP